MFTKSQRHWDAVSILLFVVCIWIPAIRLRATNWAPDLDRVELLGILGLVMGLWIGFSSFQKGWAHLLFLLFTICIPFWLLITRLETGTEWFPRAFHLFGRLSNSINEVVSNFPVRDSALFVVFCSLSMWILGYITGFSFTRFANPWVGLFITTAMFGLIDFYDTSPTATGWSGAILIFFLILLAARLFWLKSAESWIENGFLVERDVGGSILRITIILAVILVVFAWNLKTIIRSFSPGTMEQQKVSQFWQQIQKQMENNFVSLKPGTFSSGSFAEGMRLGSQAPSSLTPAFQVQVENTAAPMPVLYWRTRVYDTYDNGMWISSPLTSEGARLLSNDFLQNKTIFDEINLMVTWNEADGSLVPYPGRLAGIDLDYDFKYFEGDAALPGDGLLIPDDWLANGEEFTLRTQVFAGKISDLKQLPTNLPDWMRKRYLQLPETLPASIRDLSTKVVVGETVFDRTQAVTEFLRNTYIYNNQIPNVPADRDPVEWFLFDQKTGFCNYFASAEVLLLRSAGIPSRLAVGFSQGEKIADGYQVRLNNGHAWPEVYFEDIGWIPFEPTVSQPPLTYSQIPGDEITDLALQLSAEERHNAENPVDQGMDLEKNAADESNLQFLRSSSIIGFIFWGALALLSFYLVRINVRKPDKISFAQKLLNGFESRRVTAPAWLRKWAWYEGLAEPARQYFRLERLVMAMKLVKKDVTVPSELMRILKSEMPELTETIHVFQEGLYAEIYSRQKNYDMESCKTAGAALQRALVIRFFQALFRIS